MDAISEILNNTPWWVYLVLALLIRRGLVAARPNVAQLWRLAIVPVLFAGWDLEALLRHASFGAVVGWIVALAVGAVLGHRLVRGMAVRADHVRLLVALPGDATYLVQVLLIFVVKYALGYAVGTHPAWRHDAGFLLVAAVLGGFCTGIFVGRFATLLLKYRAAPSEPLAPAGTGTGLGAAGR